MAFDNNDCPILSDVTIFQIWKIRVMAKLHDKKVWEQVDGTEVDPVPPSLYIHHTTMAQTPGKYEMEKHIA
ncbi:hypothetical protein K439DRAFT_1345101 [Ramaria rubella]|nr:hypothetical protein K439DRAFT_1345101 [Ramaria rubella]